MAHFLSEYPPLLHMHNYNFIHLRWIQNHNSELINIWVYSTFSIFFMVHYLVSHSTYFRKSLIVQVWVALCNFCLETTEVNTSILLLTLTLFNYCPLILIRFLLLLLSTLLQHSASAYRIWNNWLILMFKVNCIDLPDIRSFASSINASLLAKNGTKRLFHYCG